MPADSGAPGRLRMVQLMLHEELTVGELAEACGIPSHVASEHLRMMQHCGLLARRQDGRRIYYQVAEPTVARLDGVYRKPIWGQIKRKGTCHDD